VPMAYSGRPTLSSESTYASQVTTQAFRLKDTILIRFGS
jgi:hypothetical protein